MKDGTDADRADAFYLIPISQNTHQLHNQQVCNFVPIDAHNDAMALYYRRY